ARRPAERVPCMFLLDEANKWLPQQAGESCLSRDVQTELHQAIFGVMVRRGGKRGLGLGLATQRIAELDKRAMQSEWKFLFRQTEQVDLERYRPLGLRPEEVMNLGNGEGFVWSPAVQVLRSQMR